MLKHLRRGACVLGAVLLVFAASVGSISPAIAQSLWQGTTSTYETNSNWFPPTTPPSPPIGPGQSAVFDTAPGSITVNVTSGSIAPDSWTFNPNAQAYTISGGAVNFSLAGPLGGIIDNANTGQVVSISNNIGESTPGVQVQLNGQSTLVLSGNNTYTGGTSVSNFGTLQVQTNGAIGTGPVTMSSGIFQAGAANLSFSNNFSISSSDNILDANGFTLKLIGNISGTGQVLVEDTSLGGGGVVVLDGNNTYTGGTTICNCSTLQLGDPTHVASIVGNIDNLGTLNIVNANTSGVTLIANDGGTTTFSNSTTASSATIRNFFGGTTIFRGFSSAANANITNFATGGSTLFFNQSSAGNAIITNSSNAGTVPGFPVGLGFFDKSSAGSATIINTGFVAFGKPFALGGNDTSTAGNATITNNSGGQLEFSAFSTAGNATIITNSGGAVAFIDGSTGGNAQFVTNSTGAVNFSGSIGPNADGRITAGSIAGSGTYIIGAGNTLIVGSNNLSTVVSGVIEDTCGCGPAGPGNLVKVGSGTLTLSGPNTYTGNTTVNGGFLDVEGSIASSFHTTINAGGALTGAGIVGNTTIDPGGIFVPGNGFGTFMTVQGNLAFASGALYLVQINSTNSTFANVTGTANAAGTVGVGVAPNSVVMKQYMILQAAGGVAGTFGGVSAPGGLVGTITYDPTHAFLNLNLDFGAKNNLNVNQQNVANTLANFFNANGGISSLFALLSPAGLTQVSGELATGAQQATFNAMNLFINLLTDPFGGGGGRVAAVGGASGYAEDDSASAYAAKNSGTARDAFAKIPTKAVAARNDLLDNRWSVWGTAYGGGANISGNTTLGSNPADVRAFGFAAGADYRISPTTVAGFALGGGGTNFSVAGLGDGRSDLFQAGAFVRHTIGNAYVTAAAAYGGQQFTTDRSVIAGDFEQLHAQFNANAGSGRIEGGYRYLTPWMGITPYAAAQVTSIALPAYAERDLIGTGAFALSYAAKTVTDPRTELGVRTDRSFALQSGILTLRGRFAWAHDYNTDRSASAVFQTLPGTFFVVNGAAVAHDSALTTASAEFRWMNGWSAAATFEGEFSDVYNSYAGKGVVRYTW